METYDYDVALQDEIGLDDDSEEEIKPDEMEEVEEDGLGDEEDEEKRPGRFDSDEEEAESIE